MASEAQSASATYTSGRLTVIRDGDCKGFWLWRSAQYVVYREDNEGARVTVLSGRFRSHAEALVAARARPH